MKGFKKIILMLFLGISLTYSSGFAGAAPTQISGSKFTVGMKSTQTTEEESSTPRFSILGFTIIKKPSFAESFDVKINYTNYYFVTAAGLPGYYIGWPMSCEVEVTNKGDSDLEDLNITMVHEYYESGICDRWWFPPYPVEFTKGEQLPGDTAVIWPGIDIKKGATVILPFEYIPPYETCSGLDQTHVVIENRENNTILELYNESEAGVFCPPPPPE